MLLEQDPEVLTVMGGVFDQLLRFAQICPPYRARSQVTACQLSCGNCLHSAFAGWNMLIETIFTGIPFKVVLHGDNTQTGISSAGRQQLHRQESSSCPIIILQSAARKKFAITFSSCPFSVCVHRLEGLTHLRLCELLNQEALK